ncbi:CPBP family intramembrane glutamic endopeptidase [Anaerobaca lacustris]|uniref:CPBP family intramembrane metalloprotease n=1 Tax=Anaerobaca lacustris TaxID=3044600 RepID=A0AAW6TVK0_9BACT|nr:CPBP family intramembrane metalloprotease [Sedimentisphaerales bacterium M17dextr]
MSGSCAQRRPAGSTSLFEPAGRLLDSGRERPGRLAIETALVTGAALAAIRGLAATSAAAFQWLLIPGILVAAALVPTWIARREFPRIGLDADHAGRALRTVCAVCLCVLPIPLLGLWIAARWHLPIPLRPVIAGQGGWPAWLLYQFLYVAVAEEVFFRGYVQANVMRLFKGRHEGGGTWQRAAVILASAGCFALAHVVVQGRAISLLTFLPGLVLAWLFLRTRSLLAPVLFHGLANVGYGIMALTLG